MNGKAHVMRRGVLLTGFEAFDTHPEDSEDVIASRLQISPEGLAL